MRTPVRRRRGSVIVVVLVLITLASLLLARFMEDNSLELSLVTREADRRRLRADAQSELELALAVIAELRAIDLNKIHAPAQGFADPHAHAGFPPREGLRVTFEYEDETAKLPLSTLDKNALIQLLYSLGQEQRDAERVADAIIAWTSKKYESIDPDAADAAYQRAALSYRPARRPIRSFEEFRAIGVANDFFFDDQGRPTPLFEEFQKCVSLYNLPFTNINTAADAVLYAQGLDETQLALLRERQAEMAKKTYGQPAYFRRTHDVRQLVGGNAPLQRFDDEVCLLWVRVTVQEGLARCRVSALVAIRNDVSYAAPVPDPDSAEAATDAQGGGRLALPTIRKTTGTSTPSLGSAKSVAYTSLTPGVDAPSALGQSTLGGRSASKSINYPFQILAYAEDNGALKGADTSDHP